MPPYRPKRRACDACRLQKKRCSGSWPCALCRRLSRECVFQQALSSNGTAAADVTVSHQRSNTSVERRRELRGPSSIPQTTPTSIHVAAFNSRASPGTASSKIHDLCGTDLAGNPLEPSSPYSWLHRASLRLGNARTHAVKNTAVEDNGQTSIFSYGDSSFAEELANWPRDFLERLSAEIKAYLLTAYFERAMVTYHFLHVPTVQAWLDKLGETHSLSVEPQEACIAVLVLAFGALYLTQDELSQLHSTEGVVVSSEHLFQVASSSLDQEHGQPTLGSIQARLLQVHYLLSSSRPNRAWYVFGTVVQLAWALGLHRASAVTEDSVDQQLRRRTFWSIYATDKYVSIALGRPMLVNENYITQELPRMVDDEELVEEAASLDDTRKDCKLEATIRHISLAKIVSKGISEQHETNPDVLLKVVSRNQELLRKWRASLPPVLSGEVHPTSLVPIFRRQSEVLRTFYLNAVILINRPLLIYQHSQETDFGQTEASVEACLEASKELARRIVRFREESQKAEIYWFTQNITFNAISILYIYLLRDLQRTGVMDPDGHAIYRLALDAHLCLQGVSRQNAPSFRYCLVLDELKKEVQVLEAAAAGSNNRVLQAVADPCPRSVSETQATGSGGFDPAFSGDPMLSDSGFDSLDGPFWPWFDTLPTSWDA